MTDPVRVLVTAIGGGGNGEQLVKALRTAGGYHIIGSDVNPDCPQFGLVDEPVLLPRATCADYVEAVLALSTGRGVAAVLCGSEPELRIFSAARQAFAEAALYLPMNPAAVIATAMDKLEANRFLTDHGFAAPRSIQSSDSGALDGIDWFPVVVKPFVGSGGSRDTYIAQTPRQLDAISCLLEGQQMMVQEYVGRPDSEFTVGVLHGMDGEYINSIAVRRVMSGQLNIRSQVANTTGRSELGDRLVVSSGISHGCVGRFPEVTETCERIASALGVTGAVNIQCRLVDGEVYVFEINPRFSGTTSIRALMGYNEPDVLIRRDVLGEEIEQGFEYRSGLVLRSLTETVMSNSHVPDWTDLL